MPQTIYSKLDSNKPLGLRESPKNSESFLRSCLGMFQSCSVHFILRYSYSEIHPWAETSLETSPGTYTFISKQG